MFGFTNGSKLSPKVEENWKGKCAVKEKKSMGKVLYFYSKARKEISVRYLI